MRRMWLVVCALATGCGEEAPPACKTVDTECAPGYVPTFSNIYANTMQQGCGSTRSACHSAQGRAGELSFQDQATAYQQLIESGHVVAGDAACSEMVVRIDSPGTDYQMPPGDPLSPGERCAIIQWVQQGAMP